MSVSNRLATCSEKMMNCPISARVALSSSSSSRARFLMFGKFVELWSKHSVVSARVLMVPM